MLLPLLFATNFTRVSSGRNSEWDATALAHRCGCRGGPGSVQGRPQKNALAPRCTGFGTGVLNQVSSGTNRKCFALDSNNHPPPDIVVREKIAKKKKDNREHLSRAHNISSLHHSSPGGAHRQDTASSIPSTCASESSFNEIGARHARAIK